MTNEPSHRAIALTLAKCFTHREARRYLKLVTRAEQLRRYAGSGTRFGRAQKMRLNGVEAEINDLRAKAIARDPGLAARNRR